MATEVLRIGIAGCGLAARVHLDRLLALERCPRRRLRRSRPRRGAKPWPRGCPRSRRGGAGGRGLRRSSRVAPPGRPRRAGDLHAAPGPLPAWPWTRSRRAATSSSRSRSRPTSRRRSTSSAWRGAETARSASATSTVSGPAWSRRGDGSRPGRSGRSGWSRRPWRSPGWRRTAGPRTPGGSTPRSLGGGILADAGDHLLDALLWTTGQVAVEAAAVQSRRRVGARRGDGRRDPPGRRHPRDPGRLRRLARNSSSS